MKQQTLSVESSAGAPDALDEGEGEPRGRRRVPSLALGAAGAVVTTVYGITVMHMRVGAPLVMMALGGLTIVLSGVALWRVLDPLSREDLANAAAPRSSGRMRELEREKQLVLKAIKEIELDYQMRKIAEADYKDMVERYRARALRLISELEAGDNFRPLIERELRDRVAMAEASAAAAGGAAAPDVTSDACKSCGARNDDDARFCKKCGAKLG